MKCSALITITQDDALLKGFIPEDKAIGDRARYTIGKKGKQIIFTITAEDATAMRAAFNSITKMLVIAEKVKKVQ